MTKKTASLGFGLLIIKINEDDMYQYDAYQDPIQRPRYTGLPTFMRAPFREDYAGLDIGLVGVPLMAELPIVRERVTVLGRFETNRV